MAYETIQNYDCDSTTSIGGERKDSKTGKRYKNPTQIEGWYAGTKHGIENKLNPERPNSLHILQTAKGNVGVWGKTDLDNKMKRAKIGLMTLIAFDKMVPTKRLPMFQYIVKQDPNNVHPGLAAQAGGNAVVETVESADYGTEVAAYSEDEVTASYEEEAPLDAEEVAYDETPPVKAQAPKALTRPSADRQAATQAILNGNKTAKAS